MSRTCSTPVGSDPIARRAVSRVLDRGVLVQGPETAALEAEYAARLGVEADRAVAVSSGTAALTALLMTHNIGPGKKVAIPAVTFTATALAVLAAGAKPVIVDVNSTWSLSPTALRRVHEEIDAVIGVDLHGIPAYWEGIERAVDLRTYIFEDACPAHGARYRGQLAGTLARDGAAFSFNESKQIPAGEGGLVIAREKEAAKRIREMRHFGHDPALARVRPLRAIYLGNNWKITEMAAALARVGLRRLPETVMRSRLNAEEICRAIQKAPAGLTAPGITPDSEPSWFKIRVSAPSPASALRVSRWLDEQGVPIAQDEVAPLPQHPTFCGYTPDPCPNAAQLDRTFVIGDRANPIFGVTPEVARQWAEVVRCIPSDLLSP